MSRYTNPRPQLFDSSGDPLVSGKLFFYESGTSTPKTTYADINLTIPNAHPVVLTADGRVPNIFFDGAARNVLTNNADVQLWDVDPVGDSTLGGNFEQWIPSISYALNDIVEGSDGNFYKSFTSGNLGNDPTTTPTAWQEVDFINTWNTNVSYSVGNTVKASDNLFYVSDTNNNQGNDPTTDAVNWSSAFDGVSTVTGGTGIGVTGTAQDPIISNSGVISTTGGTGITLTGTAADPIINADNNGTVTSVATAGLATGGPITTAGTVTVPKASAAEVATGTNDINAVTPLAMADALLGVNNLSDVAGTQTSLDTLIADNFVGLNKGTDIASAATIVIPTDGDYFELTGAITVADMTVVTNREFTLKAIAGDTFTASATIVTIDGNDLILSAGQTVTLQSTAANVVQVISVGSVSIISGWEFVSSVAASASATVQFTGFIAGYDFMVEINNVLPATDNTLLQAQLGIAGPTFRTTGYDGAGTGIIQTGVSFGETISTHIPICVAGNGQGNVAGEEGSFTVLIRDPETVSRTNVNVVGGNFGNSTGRAIVNSYVIYATAEAHDAIQFFYSSGNITQGDFILYRRKRS